MSALLAVARRLARDLKSGRHARAAVRRSVRSDRLADRARASSARTSKRCGPRLAAPISFGEWDIALTVSIGAAVYDPKLHAQGRRPDRRRATRARQRQESGRRPGECSHRPCASQRSDRQIAREGYAPRARTRRDHGAVPPIVRLEDRTVAGFQALIRWRHPRLGVLEEDEFRRGRRVDRRHRRHRRLCARDDGARTRRLAESARSQSADFRHRRRVVAPNAEPRSPGRPALRAEPASRAARIARRSRSPKAS